MFNVRCGVLDALSAWLLSDPPDLDPRAAIAGKLLDCSHTSLDDPVVNIARAEIVGVIEIIGCCLPYVVAVGLIFSGNFHI